MVNLPAVGVDEQHAIDVIGRRVFQKLSPSRGARRGGRLRAGLRVGHVASPTSFQDEVRAEVRRDLLPVDEDGQRLRRLSVEDAITLREDELFCATFALFSETPRAARVSGTTAISNAEIRRQQDEEPKRNKHQDVSGVGGHGSSQRIWLLQSKKKPRTTQNASPEDRTALITGASVAAMNRILAASLCSLLGLSCTPSPEAGDTIPGCEGKCDGIGDYAPLAGPESLVHCELTGDRDVVCDYTGVPESFPIGVSVDVTVIGQPYTDLSGRIQPAQTASIEFQQPGSVTLLGAVPADQLPLIVLVGLDMRAAFLVGDQFDDRSDLRSVSQTFTFAAPGDETPDLPLPLEFWPVRLFAAEGGNVRNTNVGPQSIDVTPWEFFIGPSVVSHDFALPTIQAEPENS